MAGSIPPWIQLIVSLNVLSTPTRAQLAQFPPNNAPHVTCLQTTWRIECSLYQQPDAIRWSARERERECKVGSES